MHMHDEEDAPIDDERFREVISRVEQAGREVGLYLEKAHVGVPQGEELTETTILFVMAEFQVGDLAFSSRVLDPASETTNTVVRGMEVDYEKEAFEAARKRLVEGTGPLGDLADDD